MILINKFIKIVDKFLKTSIHANKNLLALMNILVVALNFSPEIVGCAKFTSEFVNWFSKKTNRVIVITTNPFYPQWKCEINRYSKTLKGNIQIIRCPIYIPKKSKWNK